LLIQHSRAFLSLNPTRTRTLRINFLWNAAGNAVFALSQWGILVVFAKLGSPILVGQLVYGLALTAPLFVVAGLQLRSIQATDANNKYALGKYLGLRVLTTLAAVIVTIIVSTFMWAAGNQAALIILFWGLTKAIDSGSDALYGFFQQSERMDYVGVSLILRGLLAISSVALVFHASHSALLALTGLLIAWVAVLILFDIPVARSILRSRDLKSYPINAQSKMFDVVLDRRLLTSLFFEAAPLGVVIFLLTIQVQIPRYVVAGFLHTRELGLFSAAAYITFIGSTLANALGAPACVRLAKYHATGERSAFLKLMKELILVAAALGTAGILVSTFAGARILALLYTDEYSRMAGVLTILCVGSALSYFASFLGYAMTALKRYRIQAPIGFCVVLITLIGCYWLTGRYGLMGTAFGVLAGNLGQLIMCAGVVWQTVRRDGKQTSTGSCADVRTVESGA